MDMYVGYFLFECNFHNMFIHPNDDLGVVMALLSLCITEEDIQQGIVEWPMHLQPIPAEEMDTLEMHTKRNQDHTWVEVAWL
jgi:hypothetical protein